MPHPGRRWGRASESFVKLLLSNARPACFRLFSKLYIDCNINDLDRILPSLRRIRTIPGFSSDAAQANFARRVKIVEGDSGCIDNLVII